MKTVIHFIKSESGDSLIQYCLLSGLVSCAIIGPLKLIGERLAAVFLIIANALVVQ